jgi:hypothetical protein
MAGIVDFHVHSAPSVVPRHSLDPETKSVLDRLGVEKFVLKAHEGSTAERAALVGAGALGGIVLNSPVGGANPDAVEVAARLGARIAWLPTSSSPAHQASTGGPANGQEVHGHFSFRPVPVCTDGRLRPEWIDVLEIVARYDLVLASGHVPMDETLAVFEEAARRGVRRFLVNHPLLDYLKWGPDAASALQRLNARVEIGVLADQAAGTVKNGTGWIAAQYPAELLVFGSDLGFVGYPTFEDGYRSWMVDAEKVLGPCVLDHALRAGGHELLQ